MKKFFSIGLAVVMLFMMGTMALAATEEKTPDDILTPIDGSNYAEIEQEKSVAKAGFSGAREATAEDIAESIYQSAKKDKLSAEKEKLPAKASWNQLDDMSSFYYYAQAKSYSCGAACVRMALRYLTGVNYTEATVRTGCNTTTSGTYLSDMKTYINSEQSANTYVTKYGASKTTMKDNLYSGIVTWDAPPIMGLKEKTSSGWPFDLAAHFITVYSIMSDKSEIAIADPWAGYVSSTSSYKWYNMTTDDVYTAYNAVNCGYMY